MRSRVGIIGAGQLGRMLALAAYPLGVECRFLDTYAEAPGGQVGPIRVAALDDESAIAELAREVDVLTFDIENVSVARLEAVSASTLVRPAPALVAQAQDRLLEKRLFERLGIPTAPHVGIDDADDLARAAETLGWPIVLKTRRQGYDGRGQRIVETTAALEQAWKELDGAAALAEACIDFECEVSLIGVASADGRIAFYPLSENRHRDGMLECSIAPYPNPALQVRAEEWMTAMIRSAGYVGVLTIEFFVAGDTLIANEIAPRVHNSGHWTIEGARCSQFENHIRAILDLPLGATGVRGVSVMRNLVGSLPPRDALLALDGLHLHDYGKQPRPGRKIGHCTIVEADRDAALGKLRDLEAVLADA